MNITAELAAAWSPIARLAVVAGLSALLLACSQPAARPGSDGAKPAALVDLKRADLQWLDRVTFGLDSATLAEYRRLGRAGFLEAQLRGERNPALPPAIAAQIDALPIAHLDPTLQLIEVNAEYKRINALADGADKEQARKSLNESGNKLAYAAIRRDLLRAVYSPAQLQEQMMWFWLNHFSVHQYKANLRWTIADYEEHAIRPHALGAFADLVLATLQHPAMLQYLDNAQNAAGHINENYARELMELHTLGVDAGYTQQDVQELARILTGVGINTTGETPRLRREWRPLYRRAGAFEFNPARHDFGRKQLLGQVIDGEGFGEVERAVHLITQQPACARFIARKLALYFVSDTPPPQLIARMAQTFQRTDGNIAEVLRTLFLSPEFGASLGQKFKDPMHYVVSAVRFAYDGRTINNTRPLLNWLNALGQPPYGRQTPDGYPLTELAWTSSGQMSRRFEIARAIGSGNAGLFDAEAGGGAGARARGPRVPLGWEPPVIGGGGGPGWGRPPE
ncbi:MAG: DUF1800 domain-containing protein, partial [Steroidobacterales bacterium]